MKSKILILIVLVFLLISAVSLRDSLRTYTQKPTTETPVPPGGDAIACTMDAMMCPDGSYVGRTGPHCEFVCPAGTSTPATTSTIKARIGQTVEVGGVQIIPREILEDSRCPVDVVCIQAGTVRLKVSLDTPTDTDEVLTLNKPFDDGEHTIVLVEVSPAPVSKQQRKPSDYSFTFKVTESIPEPI